MKLFQFHSSLTVSFLWHLSLTIGDAFVLDVRCTKTTMPTKPINPYPDSNMFVLGCRSNSRSSSSIPLITPRQLLSATKRDDTTEMTSSILQRRRFLRRVVPLVIGTSSIISSSCSSSRAEVLQVGQCSGGLGEGCVNLSEGNDFIRSLQEKSAQNRDVYAKQALDAYQLKNYPDYFSSVGRFLVKKPDGTFILLTQDELNVLKKAGKIGIEQPPKVMGGKVTDFSQKPILVLKE